MHPEQDKGPCSPSALPQDPLGGMRIVDHLRGEVEAHRRPAGEVVTRPARIAAGGEGYPGRVHRVCHRLRSPRASERLMLILLEVIKDKGQLQRMARAQPPGELRRPPGELVHIGRLRMRHTGFRHAHGRDTVKPIRDEGGEQVAGARLGSSSAIERLPHESRPAPAVRLPQHPASRY